jgi:hypothetical protein
MLCFGAGAIRGTSDPAMEFAVQPTELVTLNSDEFDRLKVIQTVVDARAWAAR